MKNIILDIETKVQDNLMMVFTENIKPSPRLKDPVKIKADIKKQTENAPTKMMIDTDYADIACIGLKMDDEQTAITDLKGFSQMLELLEDDGQDWRLITYNGNKFDLPIIMKQAIKQGIWLPFRKLVSGTSKYRNDSYNVDLMELLCFGNQYKSLDVMLQIYLGIEKTPINFQTCTEGELVAHCIEDIENTHKLFNKFKDLV